MTQVNVQNVQPPREVQEAFDDVIRAREDEQREKNNAETYANGVIPEARGQAQRILEEANGYRDEVIARAEGEAERFNKLLAEYKKAPEITRQRLYLETMEEMYSNTSKVLLSGDKGQNSLMYLPLDKLMEAALLLQLHGCARHLSHQNGSAIVCLSQRPVRPSVPTIHAAIKSILH